MPTFRVVAYGCSHEPICHPGYFQWLLKTIEEVKPHYIYNLGDLYEGIAGSRHTKDPRHNWSLMDEHRAVAKHIKAINEVAPHASKYWLYGNHDDNLFGVHADRLPEDLRELANWQTHEFVAKELSGWRVKETYKHGARVYLGQLSFGHGCPVGGSSAKDEAYSYGVPYGLDVRSHTHRPEAVTQAKERQVLLPYSYCNVGTGADWEKMHYMDRQSKLLWGRGCLVAEVNCAGEGREVRASKNWDAEVLVHSYANEGRFNLRVG